MATLNFKNVTTILGGPASLTLKRIELSFENTLGSHYLFDLSNDFSFIFQVRHFFISYLIM